MTTDHLTTEQATFLETLAAPIAVALSKHYDDRKRDRAVRAYQSKVEKRFIEPLTIKLGMACLESGFAPRLDITSSGYWRSYINPPRPYAVVWVSAYVNIKAWRDLIPLFEKLEEMYGFPTDAWTNTDDARSYTRIYTHTIEKEEHLSVELRVHAILPGNTDTCRRVITGYSTPYVPRPEPIYEMVCDGEPAVPPPEPAVEG